MDKQIRNFGELLKGRWKKSGSFICVGLDSEYEKIPNHLKKRGKDVASIILEFNIQIIDATSDYVCAYKPNIAFYEAEGISGIKALKQTIEYIHSSYSDIPVIIDVKRGDIGNTNRRHTRYLFDYLKADAITVNPFIGKVGIQPFLDWKNKGIFLLCRTSNEGSDEFQNLLVEESGEKKPLYQYIAENISSKWNSNNNCGLVIGATYPDELKRVRECVRDMPLLIPGIGTQGGDLKHTLKHGLNSESQGIIINSSRSIIFSSTGKDFANSSRRVTQDLHNEINTIITQRK